MKNFTNTNKTIICSQMSEFDTNGKLITTWSVIMQSYKEFQHNTNHMFDSMLNNLESNEVLNSITMTDHAVSNAPTNSKYCIVTYSFYPETCRKSHSYYKKRLTNIGNNLVLKMQAK